MIIGNLDLKTDKRSYAYTQQVLNELDLNSDSISLNKDELENLIYTAYQKGYQTGVDAIVKAVQAVYPNFQFIKEKN